MKIGIVGGTGDIGEGMALRLSTRHEVIIGSREETKARAVSTTCRLRLDEMGKACCLSGVSNQAAVDEAEIVVLGLPYEHLVSTIRSLTGFEGKIVVSPVNPMTFGETVSYVPPPEGSAGLLLKRLLPESARIVVAFNNIAAHRWQMIREELDYSVAVCSDDEEAKRTVMALVDTISNLTSLDAGPLKNAVLVESLTPLILNISKYNRMKDVGVYFR
ncbi:MAG: 8-hydroxy-5-deazaflavin:NADPH oxidoreductase [Methanofollis sp.]|nr:8-hydroxy-5-deazaflavin:NADPH oxidoreductase [Methanofollis sp.]